MFEQRCWYCVSAILGTTGGRPEEAAYMPEYWARLDLRFAAIYTNPPPPHTPTRIKFHDTNRGEVKGWLKLGDRGFYIHNSAGHQYLTIGREYADLKYRVHGMKRWRPLNPLHEAIAAYYKLRGPLK